MKETITLKDKHEDHQGKSQVLQVTGGADALEIRPKGFGEACAEDGSGVPVFMELYEGKLRLVVWADINQQDPTHIICLDGARESRRGQSSIAGDTTHEFGLNEE